jgi:O-antigen/teichoic acid export membrane protein
LDTWHWPTFHAKNELNIYLWQRKSFYLMGIVQRDSFRITIISYAGAVIGYLNKIFLFTNFLDTSQVGLANLLITISVLYAQVAALGSYNIVLRFFPFFKDKKNLHNGFLSGVLVLGLAGFIIATLLFLLFQKPFHFFYQSSSPLLVEYAFYIIPLAMASMYYQVFEAYLRSLYKNIIPSLAHEIVLRLLITMSVLLFALGYIDFRTFVMIYVAGHCVPAMLLVMYTIWIRQLLLSFRLSSMLRRMGKLIVVYGLFSLMNNLAAFLMVSIDSLMVAGMIDLGAAGVYTTMVFMASAMLIPYRSMIKVTGPVVSAYWKARDMIKMQEIYQKATASNLVVGSILFLMIWVNLDSFFHFMPGDYEAGRYVLLLLGMGKLFDMTAGLNGLILLTSRKYRTDLLFTLGLVATAFLGNLVFIPLYGIHGAALATMLTLVLFNLLRIAYIRRHYRIHPFAARQLIVPVLIIFLMYMNFLVAPTEKVWLDIFLRSGITALVFLPPVYLLKVSPELNQMFDDRLKALVAALRK